MPAWMSLNASSTLPPADPLPHDASRTFLPASKAKRSQCTKGALVSVWRDMARRLAAACAQTQRQRQWIAAGVLRASCGRRSGGAASRSQHPASKAWNPLQAARAAAPVSCASTKGAARAETVSAVGPAAGFGLGSAGAGPAARARTQLENAEHRASWGLVWHVPQLHGVQPFPRSLGCSSMRRGGSVGARIHHGEVAGRVTRSCGSRRTVATSPLPASPRPALALACVRPALRRLMVWIWLPTRATLIGDIMS